MLFKMGGAFVGKKSDNNINGEFSQAEFPQELFVYDFKKVAIATNNFHLSNKLGQGGFGLVYKVQFIREVKFQIHCVCMYVTNVSFLKFSSREHYHMVRS